MRQLSKVDKNDKNDENGFNIDLFEVDTHGTVKQLRYVSYHIENAVKSRVCNFVCKRPSYK